jgi:hypothetical protein
LKTPPRASVHSGVFPWEHAMRIFQAIIADRQLCFALGAFCGIAAMKIVA